MCVRALDRMTAAGEKPLTPGQWRMLTRLARSIGAVGAHSTAKHVFNPVELPGIAGDIHLKLVRLLTYSEHVVEIVQDLAGRGIRTVCYDGFGLPGPSTTARTSCPAGSVHNRRWNRTAWSRGRCDRHAGCGSMRFASGGKSGGIVRCFAIDGFFRPGPWNGYGVNDSRNERWRACCGGCARKPGIHGEPLLQIYPCRSIVPSVRYPSQTGFSKIAALRRNKTIYGLAETGLIIASKFESGGTWSGAREVQKHGWIPLRILTYDGMPDGNRHLIRMGGVPIADADLIKARRWREIDQSDERSLFPR